MDLGGNIQHTIYVTLWILGGTFNIQSIAVSESTIISSGISSDWSNLGYVPALEPVGISGWERLGQIFFSGKG
jgi:hypothetical protein